MPIVWDEIALEGFDEEPPETAFRAGIIWDDPPRGSSHPVVPYVPKEPPLPDYPQFSDRLPPDRNLAGIL